MDRICKLIGHKTSSDYTDCGYAICQRCGSHGYHNFEDDWLVQSYYWPIRYRHYFRIYVIGRIRQMLRKSQYRVVQSLKRRLGIDQDVPF